MLSVNWSGISFTREILTKIVLAEAEIFADWQRQRQAEAEVKKYHIIISLVCVWMEVNSIRKDLDPSPDNIIVLCLDEAPFHWEVSGSATVLFHSSLSGWRSIPPRDIWICHQIKSPFVSEWKSFPLWEFWICLQIFSLLYVWMNH